MNGNILMFNEWFKLNEQTSVEQSKYGKYEFGASFPDNFITPKAESYKPVIDKMISDLKQAIADGKKLSDLTISIRSSASSRNATNAYKGHAHPNHNFGGLLKSGWVKSGSETGIVNVDGGNEFLAKQRGLKTKEVVVSELTKAGLKINPESIKVLPRKDGKWVADSKDSKEQYVNVIIEGLLSKPENVKLETKPKYKYSIIYNWYKIGESNIPYVLLDGTEVPQKILKQDSKLRHGSYGRGLTKVPKRFKEAVAKSGSDIIYAGFRKSPPDEVFMYAFAAPLTNYVDAKGSMFYYNDEKAWLEDVKKLSSLNPSGGFQWQSSKDGGKMSNAIVDGQYIHAGGSWNIGKSGQANFEHGAGKLPNETTLYLIKPGTGELKQAKHQKGQPAGEYYETIKCSNVYNMKNKPNPDKAKGSSDFVR